MRIRSHVHAAAVSAAVAAALTATIFSGQNAQAQMPGTGAVTTAPPAVDSTVLTLIGTQGGPGVTVRRSGPSSLLTIRGKQYLVDAGIGTSRRLAEAGVPLTSLTEIFITHQHNDHTAGLVGLMALYLGRRPLEIIGPPRTADFVAAALPLMQLNWEIRAEEGGAPVAQMAGLYKGRDVQPGLVYADDTVRVTALENTHFQFAPGSRASPNKSYAYRFQTPHKVVVFTGDTGAQPALAKFAEGADILVSEMVSPAVLKNVTEANRFHMVHEHLSPTEVGQLARDAKVKMLVLSHLVGAAPEDLAEIRKWYPGQVVLGEDLQTFK
jgi:ribonuclease BN (tRNA processing enzyme)